MTNVLKKAWYGVFVPLGLLLTMIPVGIVTLLYTIAFSTGAIKNSDNFEWMLEKYGLWAERGIDICLTELGF